MSVLEALGDWAESEGLGTLGSDLFLSRMPDSPDACVTIYEYDGGTPVEVLGPLGIALDRVRIQFVGRSARDDYPQVRDKMLDIRTAVAGLYSTVVSGVSILRARPLGYLNQMGYDAENRWKVTLNVEVVADPNYAATPGFGVQAFGTTRFGG